MLAAVLGNPGLAVGRTGTRTYPNPLRFPSLRLAVEHERHGASNQNQYCENLHHHLLACQSSCMRRRPVPAFKTTNQPTATRPSRAMPGTVRAPGPDRADARASSATRRVRAKAVTRRLLRDGESGRASRACPQCGARRLDARGASVAQSRVWTAHAAGAGGDSRRLLRGRAPDRRARRNVATRARRRVGPRQAWTPSRARILSAPFTFHFA